MKKQKPLERYLSLCKNGELESDQAQKAAAEKLQHLHDSLVGYKPDSESWLTGLKERLKINNKPSNISFSIKNPIAFVRSSTCKNSLKGLHVPHT